MKKFYTLSIAVCLSVFVSAQTATFTFTYTGFTPQAQAAFEYAAGIWAHTVVSAVPIKVLAHFQQLPTGTLGITFPNGRKNFTNAPLPDKWYSTSLANSIAGVELNPGEVDIEIYLSSTTNWYYDSTGTVPSGKYDFVTIALHELCHGLGFLSIAKKTGTTGSLGMLTSTDFYPFTTSYPWPNLDTLPSVFDSFLVTDQNEQLDTFPNPSILLGSKLTSNAIYFNGTNAMAANNGTRPRIYAPLTFALGSSITHFNEATYPAGNINELMTPNGNPGYKLHDPGPLCIGVLKDIGWTISPNVGIAETNKEEPIFSVYPNPAYDYLFTSSSISNEKIKSIELKNMLGEKMMDMENNSRVSVSDLPKGVYFIIFKTLNYQSVQKFIKG